MSMPMPPAPLPVNAFIIFCIWLNCLTSWFTSWVEVPLPAAILRRHDL